MIISISEYLIWNNSSTGIFTPNPIVKNRVIRPTPPIVKNESYIPAKINDILNIDEEMIILENDMLSVKNFITKNI